MGKIININSFKSKTQFEKGELYNEVGILTDYIIGDLPSDLSAFITIQIEKDTILASIVKGIELDLLENHEESLDQYLDKSYQDFQKNLSKSTKSVCINTLIKWGGRVAIIIIIIFLLPYSNLTNSTGKLQTTAVYVPEKDGTGKEYLIKLNITAFNTNLPYKIQHRRHSKN